MFDRTKIVLEVIFLLSLLLHYDYWCVEERIHVFGLKCQEFKYIFKMQVVIFSVPPEVELWQGLFTRLRM